jgi:hypothetical protein
MFTTLVTDINTIGEFTVTDVNSIVVAIPLLVVAGVNAFYTMDASEEGNCNRVSSEPLLSVTYPSSDSGLASLDTERTLSYKTVTTAPSSRTAARATSVDLRVVMEGSQETQSKISVYTHHRDHEQHQVAMSDHVELADFRFADSGNSDSEPRFFEEQFIQKTGQRSDDATQQRSLPYRTQCITNNYRSMYAQ